MAQTTYPTRPITIVVGFAAGGPADTIARILAERLKLKQS
jgi:tripartite-type tricarboxylate transporter receptor subunit TctC